MLYRRTAVLLLSLSACDLSREGIGMLEGVDPSSEQDARVSPPKQAADPEPADDDDEDIEVDAGPMDARVERLDAQGVDVAAPPVVDSAPAPCTFAGTHALRIDARVSWSGAGAGWTSHVAAGGGAMSLFALARVDDTGGVSLQACGATMPTVYAVTAASYGGAFPDAIWDRMSTRWSARFALACTQPGCALTSDGLQAQLGTSLAAQAPWPATMPLGVLHDDDGDGVPGVPYVLRTPMLLVSSSTNYPGPIGGPGGTGWQSDTVTTLMLALRFGARFEGKLESCSAASGTATEPSLASHVVSCRMTATGLCRADQASVLDQSLPPWSVSEASWRMQAVSDLATCADVRTSLAN